MDSQQFLDIYGSTGYYLRQAEVDTSSRIAMMASLVYLQQQSDGPVQFDEVYEFSLDQTDEKLEKGSFKNFIKKLEKSKGSSDLIVKEDDGYKCSDVLLEDFFRASEEFNKLVGSI